MKIQVNKGFTVKAKRGLLSRLHHLTSGPTPLRAFLSTAVPKVSYLLQVLSIRSSEIELGSSRWRAGALTTNKDTTDNIK